MCEPDRNIRAMERYGVVQLNKQLCGDATSLIVVRVKVVAQRRARAPDPPRRVAMCGGAVGVEQCTWQKTANEAYDGITPAVKTVLMVFPVIGAKMETSDRDEIERLFGALLIGGEYVRQIETLATYSENPKTARAMRSANVSVTKQNKHQFP
ncbi:hypothetical protein EVAR_32298_1 [Eumeta japonica]|uniref:Uncharacterized protein n=1 Tax=Eumeta variegata TaxID=151549 RepID=A0A4C1WEQ3_EUMVA|nr:hypothetical protein EVAR_32298_1 [Eumeta japonica]